jgi:hypothetical protein
MASIDLKTNLQNRWCKQKQQAKEAFGKKAGIVSKFIAKAFGVSVRK